MTADEVVRVRCSHRIGLAFRAGETLSLLPCDCNAPSEVLEVVASVPTDCTAAGGCVRDSAADCAATFCNAERDALLTRLETLAWGYDQGDAASQAVAYAIRRAMGDAR